MSLHEAEACGKPNFSVYFCMVKPKKVPCDEQKKPIPYSCLYDA